MSVLNPPKEQVRLEALRSYGILDTEAIVPCVGENGKPRQFVAIGTDITEREEAAKLRGCLAVVVESSDEAIISETLDGTITTWNFGAEKLFGYSSSEAVGKHVRMLLAPERATEETDILARIERGERVDHFETVCVRKDGKKIDVSATISPIKDSGGAIVGASTIARDITERRRLEESLCKSEEGFQAMANGIQQLAWMAEADGSVSWYNQRWYEYTGTTLEQVQGWGWQKVHDPEVLPKVLEEWEGAIAAGKPFDMEFPLRGADGRFRMFLTRVMPVRDSQGHVVRWLGTNTDISERKQAEGRLVRKVKQLARQRNEMLRSRKALQDQTALLQSVLNSTDEGFIAADESGQFTLWNPAAEKLLGLGAANIPSQEWTAHYGLFLSDMRTPFPADQFPLARAIRGESSTVELFVRNPKVAEGIWMDATGHPLKGTDGLHHGGVVVFHDIGQRKATEHTMQTLNQTLERRVAERTAQLEEACRELESFTYSAAHDLRAPLRHIAGFSGILVEDFSSSLDVQVQSYLQRIQEGARRMGQLMDELLSLAQISGKEPNLQQVGLNSMIEEVIDVLQPETEGRQVHWRIADLSFIECDAALIRQAFQNLISNALKYSRPRPLAIIEIGRIQENGHLTFFVRDNGVGFNMKYADKLFGVFQRLHRLEDFEGVGIGLATVQRIIKKHHGLVWAEAQLDKGATFYFTIGGQQTPTIKEQTILAGV